MLLFHAWEHCFGRMWGLELLQPSRGHKVRCQHTEDSEMEKEDSSLGYFSWLFCSLYLKASKQITSTLLKKKIKLKGYKWHAQSVLVYE